MPSETQAIAQAIRSLASPPEAELADFSGSGRRRICHRGEIFTALGDERYDLAFVHAGALKYHFITEDGRDVAKDFALPGRFCMAYGSATQGAPAETAITAIEDSILTVWPWEYASRLMAAHEQWAQLGRRIAETIYRRKERREMQLLTLTAAERLRLAEVEFGSLIVRLSRSDLASYLGVTPESLSRIRRGKAATRHE